LFGPDQYLSSQTRIKKVRYFMWDERDSTISKFSSDYDTNPLYLAIVKFMKQYISAFISRIKNHREYCQNQSS
jgi:hypothetical protein